MTVSHQYERGTRQPVHQAIAVWEQPANADIAVDATGTWDTDPATKMPMAAANFTVALDPSGHITLDDANDRILLQPGVYEVSFQLRLRDNGVDSDAGVSMTTAAGAAVDFSHDNIHGSNYAAQLVDPFVKTSVLTVTAARAIEVHLAARTAGGQIELRAGSTLCVRRLGNVAV